MPGVAATPPPSVNSDFPARQTPPSPSTTSGATDTPKTPTISVIDEKVMNGKETRERRPPTSPASHRSKRAQHAAQHHQNHQHPGSLHYRQQNQRQYMRPYNSYSIHRHQALPEEIDPLALFVGKVGLGSGNDVEQALSTIFEKHGEVVELRVVRHKTENCNFAFVKFYHTDAIESALTEDGTEVCGRRIVVRRKHVGNSYKRGWRNRPELRGPGTTYQGPLTEQEANLHEGGKAPQSPSKERLPIRPFATQEDQSNDNYTIPQWVNTKIEMASNNNDMHHASGFVHQHFVSSGYNCANEPHTHTYKAPSQHWTNQPKYQQVAPTFWPLSEPAPTGPPMFALDRSQVLPHQAQQGAMGRSTSRQQSQAPPPPHHSSPPFLPYFVDPMTGAAMAAGCPFPPYGMVSASQPLSVDYYGGSIPAGPMPVVMMTPAPPMPHANPVQQQLQASQAQQSMPKLAQSAHQQSRTPPMQAERHQLKQQQQQQHQGHRQNASSKEPTQQSSKIIFGNFTQSSDSSCTVVTNSSRGSKAGPVQLIRDGVGTGQGTDLTGSTKAYGATQNSVIDNLNEAQRCADESLPSYSLSDIAHYQKAGRPIYMPQFIDWAHTST
ncbi:hypothetical protein FA10DRAFT_285778 [Acaromyces ingoldii]|uniref:RRM domain-containing protein n=1 Tax=Acaromyces ingoldii TaxID=215250 RepID=A0A316YQL9_9BASI|nr:hypothetical protein FA10DRAFT_285778 [Acaromyces ingoldii]PWN90065.1 hypothetical protein FA10DRAFT_285778 [Acaromyces ingoldii]